MNPLSELFLILREAKELVRIKVKESIDRDEKKSIAQMFNDRYTYRKEWVPDMDRLPGSAMYGINPRTGYAWMCPECNKIHHPTESSVFSGLQYPRCCSTYEGNRLDHGIRVE
jgi:hypothetical protein